MMYCVYYHHSHYLSQTSDFEQLNIDIQKCLRTIDIIKKGLSIYYVSSYNKTGSFRVLTNAYRREQGFIQKLMSYENPH